MPTPPHDPPRAPKPADESIIPLSRYRAQVARGRARRRADEILESADPARLVPTLSVQDMYYAIQEIGLNASHDLMALATPSQVRGFIDLDAWEKDQFIEGRAAPWLDVLIDLGPDALLRALSGLDAEVVALWLQRQARVYDLEQEQPPEEPEGHYYPTPDSFFLLDVLGEGEDGKRLERFVDWLYRADLEFAKRALMAARWELPSDLEEYAFRWRSGRMADLGYVGYYEALSIYAYLDPATVKLGEHTAEAPPVDSLLPVELFAQLGESSFLSRALARVGEAAELERLSGALLQLMNRVMSADRVDPADMRGAEQTMKRAANWLGLGLELMSQGDSERAAEVLADVSLARIFRVGFSLTLKLKRAADALVAHAWVSLVPGEATLLDSPLAELVAGVRKPRPMLAREFMAELAPKGAQANEERPFASLSEVAQAARALEEAAQMGEAIRRGLGVEPRLLGPEARAKWQTPGDMITFAAIVGTLAVNLLLERPAALVALAGSELAALAERVLENGSLRPSARLVIERGFAARMAEREYPPPEGWSRWMEGWLGELTESLRVAVDQPAAARLLVRR